MGSLMMPVSLSVEAVEEALALEADLAQVKTRAQTLALMMSSHRPQVQVALAQVKTRAQTLAMMMMNSHRPQSLYPALLIFTHAKNSKYATMKTHVPKLMTSRNATKATNSQHGLPILRHASITRPKNSGQK